MPTLILLLRGVNVGGKNKLPMAQLKVTLEELALRDVETYIQSGNVVCRAARFSKGLEAKIANGIDRRHGFRPDVLALTRAELDQVIGNNPFPEAESEPKSLHAFICAYTPKQPKSEALEQACADDERYQLRERVLYLHAPAGVGRSKLAANAERWLGVAVTARNWRTIRKLSEMAGKTST